MDSESQPLSSPARGLAVSSVALGFMSMLLFWWFPFGLCLSLASITLGGICFLLGIRGGLRDHQPEGEHLHLGLVGATMAMSSAGVIFGVYKGLQSFMYDEIGSGLLW